MGNMRLRLREIREGRGLTLEKAAELVDRAASTVSRHEREEGINVVDLRMYCEAYGVNMAECLTGPHLLSAREKEALYVFRRLRRNQLDAILSTMVAMIGDDEDEKPPDET